ncbi:MAG: hypothetical protein Q8K19_12745, partial [Methylicorpusculum sp.]|nr:hypothetical protein [Methylicorpusculum sp.]MDP3529486.1 hypothetical protein [Methylicorpusculum sp.]
CYSSLSALLIKCSRPLNVAVCALRGSSATLVSIVLAILNNIADTVTYWGFEDPVAVQGNEDAQHHAFKLVFNFILTRIRYFIVLPLEKLDALATQHEIDKIGQLKNDL